MKNQLLFFLFAVFFTQLVFSQTDDNNSTNFFQNLEMGVYAGAYLPSSISESFIGETYDQQPGFKFDLRVGMKNFLGLGFSYSAHKADIKNSLYIGNEFSDARLKTSVLYVYYLYTLHEKFLLEVKLGYGMIQIVNNANPGEYIIDYNTFMAGVNLQYNVTKNDNIRIILGPDLLFLHSNKLGVASEHATFFKKATILNLNLGMAFYL